MGIVVITSESISLASALQSYCSNTADARERELFNRYTRIHEKLEPFHRVVEKSAYTQAVQKWNEDGIKKLEETNSEEEKNEIYKSMWEDFPVFYLNDHGPKHIETVLERARNLLSIAVNIELNAYELFLLLCAIEMHDVGNMYGREGHEKSIGSIIYKIDSELLDSVEKRAVQKIAMTHGGKIGDSKDTICKLPKESMLFNHRVRYQMLAAILRFADELADDCSRASRVELEMGMVPRESEIFHRYSEALHTVVIQKEDKDYFSRLCFSFTSGRAIQKFYSLREDKYLLDEIYDRTLKMERERRYCMRFMRPYINIEGICVEISIEDDRHPLEVREIRYTLNECGYPTEPAHDRIGDYIENNPTGESVAQDYQREGEI